MDNVGRLYGRCMDRFKSATIQIRVSFEEKEAFKSCAGLTDITLSVWIRGWLRHAAKSELKAADRPIAFIKSRPLKSERDTIQNSDADDERKEHEQQ